MNRIDATDILMFLGLALVAVGVWQYSQPAAFIVVGCALCVLGGAAIYARRKPEDREPNGRSDRR